MEQALACCASMLFNEPKRNSGEVFPDYYIDLHRSPQPTINEKAICVGNPRNRDDSIALQLVTVFSDIACRFKGVIIEIEDNAKKKIYRAIVKHADKEIDNYYLGDYIRNEGTAQVSVRDYDNLNGIIDHLEGNELRGAKGYRIIPVELSGVPPQPQQQGDDGLKIVAVGEHVQDGNTCTAQSISFGELLETSPDPEAITSKDIDARLEMGNLLYDDISAANGLRSHQRLRFLGSGDVTRAGVHIINGNRYIISISASPGLSDFGVIDPSHIENYFGNDLGAALQTAFEDGTKVVLFNAAPDSANGSAFAIAMRNTRYYMADSHHNYTSSTGMAHVVSFPSVVALTQHLRKTLRREYQFTVERLTYTRTDELTHAELSAIADQQPVKPQRSAVKNQLQQPARTVKNKPLQASAKVRPVVTPKANRKAKTPRIPRCHIGFHVILPTFVFRSISNFLFLRIADNNSNSTRTWHS